MSQADPNVVLKKIEKQYDFQIKELNKTIKLQVNL